MGSIIGLPVGALVFDTGCIGLVDGASWDGISEDEYYIMLIRGR